MSTPNTAMEIPAKLVKELRNRTNAGFNDCRAALVEAGGDIEKAIAVLRKKGQAAAAKKATREATEGLVGSYIHAGGKIGVLVEVNCESDFVARTEAFQHLCHDIAMHIAALDPRYVRREEVTPEMLEKFYEDNCLYEQHYIKDEGTTIREMVASAIAKLGENISIKRFARFKVGEVTGTSGPETVPVPAPVKA